MKMDKPTHNMSPRRRGDDLTASTINQLMAKIRASIVGGKGILIRRGGDQIIIETARGGRSSGRSTSGGFIPYLAESEEELPEDVDAYAQGFITEGDDVSAWYQRNRANDGWVRRAMPVLKVATLPAIPTTGVEFVEWTSESGGTGDDQVWMGVPGATEWTAMQFHTSKSGAPPS